MAEFGWATLVGGFAFFFLGLGFSREGMQQAAGERLRQLMGRTAGRTIFAVAADALVAMLLQSSRAAILIAVSLAAQQFMTLAQAFAVILGADTGTALLLVLLSIHQITEAALILVVVGMLGWRYGRGHLMRAVGQALLGVGLVFFGMHLLMSWAAPLAESSVAASIFAYLATHQSATLILAAILTVAVRNSAATIAVAIALAASGAFPIEVALPVVLGANLGSALMAGVACLRHGLTGRRVAAFYVVVKLAGVVVAYACMGWIIAGADGLDAFIAVDAQWGPLPTGVKVALFHLAFNVALAVAAMPFVLPAAMLAMRLIPDRSADREEFGPKYLDADAVATPELAFAHARREVLRIAKIAHDMFATVLTGFRLDVDFDALSEKAGGDDDKIDELEKAVRFYLARVSQRTLSEVQASTEVALITIAGDLEDIGDSIQRGLMRLARKKRHKLARFSEEGLGEIHELHKLVLENFDLTISMLTHPHEEIARKVMRHEQHLDEVEQELRQSHLTRLHERIPESFESSTIHLDILSLFRVINAKLMKVCQTAVELV